MHSVLQCVIRPVALQTLEYKVRVSVYLAVAKVTLFPAVHSLVKGQHVCIVDVFSICLNVISLYDMIAIKYFNKQKSCK